MSGRFTQFARYSQQNNEAIEAILNMFRQNILNFLQQSRKILPNQLLKSINQLLTKQSSDRSLQQFDQNIIMIQKLLAVNKICLVYMSKKIIDLEHNQKIVTSKSTKQNQFLNDLSYQSQEQQNSHKDYKILQQSIQKAQNQIRKHIGLQQQMKICFDQQQQEIYQLKKYNRSLKDQNSQLKKQILLLKGKEKQIQKKVKGLQQRQNQNYKNQFKPNLNRLGSKKKKIDKINTQPQSNAIFSDIQYRKYTNEQYELSKQKSLNKSGQHSKLISKKSCSSNLMQSQINVNLNSSMKLKTHQNQNKMKNNQSKQIFWNRRLKKKPTTTYVNYSTNVSPRLLNKQKKSSKDRYQTLTNHTKILNQSKQYTNQLIQSSKRKAYSNSNSIEMKHSFGDRSTSVIY